MLGFLPTVLAITVFARLITLSVPKNGTIHKYVSVLVAICVSAVVMIPVADFLVSFDGAFKIDFDENMPNVNEEEYESIFEKGIAEELYPSVEGYIYKELERVFSVPRSDCEVSLKFNTDGDVISIEKVNIFLKNNAIFKDTGSICRYFEEKLTCIADVSVDLP